MARLPHIIYKKNKPRLFFQIFCNTGVHMTGVKIVQFYPCEPWLEQVYEYGAKFRVKISQFFQASCSQISITTVSINNQYMFFTCQEMTTVALEYRLNSPRNQIVLG